MLSVLTQPPSVWLGRVDAEALAGVEAACQDHSGLLRAGLSALLDRYPGSVPSRLFGIAVAGALTGRPEEAVPVGTVSRLWWAGAQALDDLADGVGEVAGEVVTPDGKAVLLAMACGTLVPFAVIDRQPLPPEITESWRRTLLGTSIQATAGQLADLASFDSPCTWAQVIRSYRGKTGAPYGRDAVMAARLSTDDPVTLRAWRVFGELFGLLRQVANDAAHDGSGIDEDLANGTLTLLLAHALETAGPETHERLLRLRIHARRDLGARAELSEALRRPGVTSGYADRIGALRDQACALLDRLAPASDHRDLLHHLLHGSARLAVAARP
ncbi:MULTISPECIES: polyprenyl synthase [Streptomyces]|uniref:Polyprenyl synthase n=2 Tax=Streptomyces TaxID=1883 RepID=A0ABV9J2R2_9ACTN